MKRNHSKILSMFLALLMMIGIAQVSSTNMKASALTTSEAANRITNLASKLGISSPNVYSGSEQRGMYFTTDKAAGSGNSDSRTDNYNVAKSSWFINTFGSGIGSGSFTQGKTCNGFAKFAQWYIFSGTAGKSVPVKWLGYKTPNKTNASQCVIGDRLSFGSNDSHQAIYLGYNDTGFIVLDSNYGCSSTNMVKIHTLPYSAYSTFDTGRGPTITPDVPSHTRDTRYGTNFETNPKRKITASEIFYENHSMYNSGAWIGTEDKCTIHEVYTDGCCKVSYPGSGGRTVTMYSKIDLFNLPHSHNYTVYIEAAHPHKEFKKCSCGDYYYTGATKFSTTVKNARSATCSREGYTGDTYCTSCNSVITYGRTTAKTAHSFENTVVAPKCNEQGYTIHICKSCGYDSVDSYTPVTGHADSNHDGKCDNCGASTGTNTPTQNCSCSCHKSGFASFIWKLTNFFNKIFGSNKVCECGVKHY